MKITLAVQANAVHEALMFNAFFSKTLPWAGILLASALSLSAQAEVIVTSLESGTAPFDGVLNFGKIEQGQIEVRTLRLTNSGKGAVAILNPEVQGDDIVFSVNSLCTRPLLSGESCNLEVEFFPQDFWGDFSAVITWAAIDVDSGLRLKKTPGVQAYGRANQAR